MNGDDAAAAEMRRRLESIRRDVAEYFDAAHPSLAAVREPIERALDDARIMLGMQSAADEFWLAFAAQQMASAEAQFINTRALIDKYGGPQRERRSG